MNPTTADDNPAIPRANWVTEPVAFHAVVYECLSGGRASRFAGEATDSRRREASHVETEWGEDPIETSQLEHYLKAEMAHQFALTP